MNSCSFNPSRVWMEMTHMPNIDGYQFGRMTIGGKLDTTDLVILYTGIVMDNWIRKSGHFLEYDDIKHLITSEPEIIIIGTGVYGRMKVAKDLLSRFKGLDIEVEILSNEQALTVYNKKIRETQKVGACFHLTC